MSFRLGSHLLISTDFEDLKRPVTFDEWQTFLIATEAGSAVEIYSVIQKDGLNFVRLYFLNYIWYVNDLHYI
jgi:hypothetical protein